MQRRGANNGQANRKAQQPRAVSGGTYPRFNGNGNSSRAQDIRSKSRFFTVGSNMGLEMAREIEMELIADCGKVAIGCFTLEHKEISNPPTSDDAAEIIRRGKRSAQAEDGSANGRSESRRSGRNNAASSSSSSSSGEIELTEEEIGTLPNILSSLMSTWIKKQDSDKEQSVKLFAKVYSMCSFELLDRMARDNSFTDIYNGKDGWSLAKLMRKTLRTQTLMHRHQNLTETEDAWNSFRMPLHGELVHFKSNYDDFLTLLSSAGATAMSEADKARKFIDKLNSKYAQFKITLHEEDAAPNGKRFPETLDDAYKRAAAVIVKTSSDISRSHENRRKSEGNSFTSMAIDSNNNYNRRVTYNNRYNNRNRDSQEHANKARDPKQPMESDRRVHHDCTSDQHAGTKISRFNRVPNKQFVKQKNSNAAKSKKHNPKGRGHNSAAAILEDGDSYITFLAAVDNNADGRHEKFPANHGTSILIWGSETNIIQHECVSTANECDYICFMSCHGDTPDDDDESQCSTASSTPEIDTRDDADVIFQQMNSSTYSVREGCTNITYVQDRRSDPDMRLAESKINKFIPRESDNGIMSNHASVESTSLLSNSMPGILFAPAKHCSNAAIISNSNFIRPVACKMRESTCNYYSDDDKEAVKMSAEEALADRHNDEPPFSLGLSMDSTQGPRRAKNKRMQVQGQYHSSPAHRQRSEADEITCCVSFDDIASRNQVVENNYTIPNLLQLHANYLHVDVSPLHEYLRPMLLYSNINEREDTAFPRTFHCREDCVIWSDDHTTADDRRPKMDSQYLFAYERGQLADQDAYFGYMSEASALTALRLQQTYNQSVTHIMILSTLRPFERAFGSGSDLIPTVEIVFGDADTAERWIDYVNDSRAFEALYVFQQVRPVNRLIRYVCTCNNGEDLDAECRYCDSIITAREITEHVRGYHFGVVQEFIPATNFRDEYIYPESSDVSDSEINPYGVKNDIDVVDHDHAEGANEVHNYECLYNLDNAYAEVNASNIGDDAMIADSNLCRKSTIFDMVLRHKETRRSRLHMQLRNSSLFKFDRTVPTCRSPTKELNRRYWYAREAYESWCSQFKCREKMRVRPVTHKMLIKTKQYVWSHMYTAWGLRPIIVKGDSSGEESQSDDDTDAMYVYNYDSDSDIMPELTPDSDSDSDSDSDTEQTLERVRQYQDDELGRAISTIVSHAVAAQDTALRHEALATALYAINHARPSFQRRAWDLAIEECKDASDVSVNIPALRTAEEIISSYAVMDRSAYILRYADDIMHGINNLPAVGDVNNPDHAPESIELNYPSYSDELRQCARDPMQEDAFEDDQDVFFGLPSLQEDVDYDTDEEEDHESSKFPRTGKRPRCLLLHAHQMLLDTGSEIHCTSNYELDGLSTVIKLKNPPMVRGIGTKPTPMTAIGKFHGMVMYVGPSPCTIISLGVCLASGATVAWAADMSTVDVTLRDGHVLSFIKEGLLWLDNAVISSPTHPSILLSEEELRAKFTSRQLHEASVAKLNIKRLGFPGIGTLRGIVHGATVRDLPISSEGIRIQQKLSGTDIASEKGGRRKHSNKPTIVISNDDVLQPRKVILYVDLFFVQSLPFLVGVIYLPYSERPLILTYNLDAAKPKSSASLLTGITSFVGSLNSYQVQVEKIFCDQEPGIAAAKPDMETKLKIKLEQQSDHVPQAERAIQTIKMICRKIQADLPFKVFGQFTIYLIAYSATRANIWPSANYFGKLCPREALTGRKPCYKTEVNAAYGDFLRSDSTNAAFKNNLQSRAAEAVALCPTGNLVGDWIVYNLETMSTMRRQIRSGDIVPMPKHWIDKLNQLAVRHKATTLDITTTRGNLPNFSESDMDTGVLPTNINEREERSEVTTSRVPQNSNRGVKNVVRNLQQVKRQQAAIAPEKDNSDDIAESGNDAQSDQLRSAPNDNMPQYWNDDDDYGDTDSSMNVIHDTGKLHAFHISMQKGLKMFGDKGISAMRSELMSLLKTGTLRGVAWNDLSPADRASAIRSMLFFKEKYLPDGLFDKLKARLVAGGHQQDRSIYSQEQTSSPTVATESLMMTSGVAANERRRVMSIDVGSAFLRGKFTASAKPIYMRLDKVIAAQLCDIDPSFKVFLKEDGSMYVRLLKPLYGLVEAAKLWHDELSRCLLSLGFKQNPYDACTYNKMHGKVQQTIIVHVDDMLITCSDVSKNRWLAAQLKKTYEQVTVQEGSVHSYVGMTFDFGTQGQVKVTQEGYINELLATMQLKNTAKTPAADNLFIISEDSVALIAEAKREFHSTVAKLLYLSKRTRPDILVAVAFLTSRVLEATEEDQVKLTRVLRYLKGTSTLGMILRCNDSIIQLRCWVDASYGVHSDGKSHTGVVVSMGGGPVMAKSTKQKIVTKSSTEAELVGVSDSISLVIWCRNFLEAQGYKMPPAKVYQDNLSTIAMVRAGKPTSDRTRHVSIRFFFVKDREVGGEVALEYKPTKEMLADILTKPLQGELFSKLRDELLNIK